MDWVYWHRVCYGLEIEASVASREVVTTYADVFRYDKTTYSPTLFVYLQRLIEPMGEDHGNYTVQFPDTDGSPFVPPQHPVFERARPDLKSPKLLPREVEAIQALIAVPLSPEVLSQICSWREIATVE